LVIWEFDFNFKFQLKINDHNDRWIEFFIFS
jgi:hypothetical protein